MAASAGLPGAPVQMWTWDPATHAPDYTGPLGVPVVCQLTDDDGNSVIDEHDDPDVLVLTVDAFRGRTLHHGAVTALDGATGTRHFTVSSPLFGVPTSTLGAATMLAVGDVDDDGIVEILLSSELELVILEHDGTLKSTQTWPVALTRANETLGLADFNQDGVVEAYTSTTVLSVDGSLSIPGGVPTRRAVEAYSVAVDLHPSPGLELLVGNRLFDAFGGLIWHRSDVLDGSTAVADCDGDGEPEVYLATSGGLHVLDAAGNDLAPAFPLTPMGEQPPPVIADFDGDGLSEIAMASTRTLRCFEFDGVVLSEVWSAPISDLSGLSGATAFDFDGDGASELLYRDEIGWYVFDGLTGSTLYFDDFPSGTGSEYPVVADIDGDCTAEVLVIANDFHTTPGSDPIRAFEVPGIVGARAIWNQQSYHVTNVEDDGSIPVVEPKPWETHGTWLAQAPGCIQGCEAFVVSPAPGEERQQCDGFPLDVVVDPQPSSPAVLWTSSCPDTIFVPSDDVPDPMAFLGTDCDRTCELTVTIGNGECTDSVTVTVNDTERPTITGVPSDDTVECDAVPAPASPVADDNCDDTPELRFEETRTPGPCPQAYTLDRTWAAGDACGNVHAETRRLSVVDTTPPSLIGVPSDQTEQCDAVPPPATVTADDSCDPAPVVMFMEVRIDGSSPDQYELHRTWMTEDACGNQHSETQVVTVVDTAPPVPTALLIPVSPLPPISQAAPQSACSAPTSRTFEVTCSATDNCDPLPALSSRLLVENHDVNAVGECVLRVESIDVECGEQVEVRLVSAPCPADPPRRPRDALMVNSLGVTVVTGESVILEVVATDRTGNVGAASHDPTAAPQPPCDDALPDGTCCPPMSPAQPTPCRSAPCGS